MAYYVYILKCADGTLYCGSTNDLTKRLDDHNVSDKGARYTKSRRPVALIYSEDCGTQGAALSREYEIKQLSRDRKLALIKDSK